MHGKVMHHLSEDVVFCCGGDGWSGEDQHCLSDGSANVLHIAC